MHPYSHRAKHTVVERLKLILNVELEKRWPTGPVEMSYR